MLEAGRDQKGFQILLVGRVAEGMQKGHRGNPDPAFQ